MWEHKRLYEILEEVGEYENENLIRKKKEMLIKRIKKLEIVSERISEGYFAIMYPNGGVGFIYKILEKLKEGI